MTTDTKKTTTKPAQESPKGPTKSERNQAILDALGPLVELDADELQRAVSGMANGNKREVTAWALKALMDLLAVRMLLSGFVEISVGEDGEISHQMTPKGLQALARLEK